MKLSKRIRKNHLAGKNVLHILWGNYKRDFKKISFEEFLGHCLFVQGNGLKLGKNLI